MKQETINTGRGVFHDVIKEFDDSGRVVVATCQDIALYESEQAYRGQDLPPMVGASIFGEAIDDESSDGYVRSIVDGEQQLTVNHVLGCSLHVTKDPTA